MTFTGVLVLSFHDRGHTPAQIASALGITQHRVESILDREAAEAGPLREWEDAPAAEPETASPKRYRSGVAL